MRLFLRETKANSSDKPCVTDFIDWCTNHLQSPRSIWLFSMSVSLGSVLVVLRAAIRNNNVDVAKGCVYLLKCLAWAENLTIYRQCIIRSGIAEEVQVMLLVKKD